MKKVLVFSLAVFIFLIFFKVSFAAAEIDDSISLGVGSSYMVNSVGKNGETPVLIEFNRYDDGCFVNYEVKGFRPRDPKINQGGKIEIYSADIKCVLKKNKPFIIINEK